MKTIKCPKCDLQNWETAEWCAGCKTALKPKAQVGFAASSAASDSQNSNTARGDASQANFGGASSSETRNNSKTAFSAADGFFARTFKSRQRNSMIACLVTIAALLAVLFLNGRYFYNALSGPAAINRLELLDGKSKADLWRNYVVVTADDVYDTGVEYVEKSRKYNTETVKYKYVALQIGDKYLLAKVDPYSKAVDGATDISLDGELTEADNQENQKVLQPIFAKQPALRQSFLPFTIDARSGYANWAYIGLAIGSLLTLVCGVIFFRVLINYGNLESHSGLKALAARGNPQQIAQMIDEDFAKSREKIDLGFVSPEWIVKKTVFGVDVQRIEDIVWMYKKTTKHSYNFIPTGKTHEVVLHDNNRRTMILSSRFLKKEKKIDDLMDAIYSRAPWIIAGYSDDLASQWKSNPDNLIQAVADRKQEFQNN